MLSQAAKAIRATLVRDALDNRPLTVKRREWEESTRFVPTPEGVSADRVEIGGVACLSCTPDKQLSDKTIVYCHGGGLVEGSAETFREWTCRLAIHTGCRVVSIDYRLAPEHPFPAAMDDVLSVCHALLLDDAYSAGLCIGADSTGCILALLALLHWRRSRNNDLHGAFFLSPSIDLTFSGTSFSVNAYRDPLVSLDVLKQCAKLYAGKKHLDDPIISPLFADFQSLPPLLVMVDEAEIVLDDATRLVKKATESGGIAKLYISHGLWHVWPTWGEFPESTTALENIRQHLISSDE